MKRIQIIFLISALVALVPLGIMTYMAFWGPDHIEFTGKTLKQIFADEDAMTIVVVPITLIIVGLCLLPFLRIIFPMQIKNGERAKATLLKVWDTGTTINDDP